MKKVLLLISLLILAIALSGCTSTPNALEFAKTMPEVQGFLFQEHALQTGYTANMGMI